MMDLCFPGLRQSCKWDKSDWFITFPNGSEIWFGGLDDKERTDKILGKEFSTIFFNECSEMSYESVGVAHTRLSQKNSLKNRFYYDCNPPKENHWSNKLFLKKCDPLSDMDEPLDSPDDYASIKINPRDNAENLDPDYITEVLEKLPPALRLRFLDGEYGSDDSDIIRPEWIIPSVNLNPAKIEVKFTFVDPAYTEKARATNSSCESAVVTVGIDEDGLIHDLEVLHGMWSYQELKNVCKATFLRHQASQNYIFGIEDVAAQRWLQEDLQRDGVHCVLIKPDGDKIRRTISVTDLIEQGRCRINDKYLTSQLLGFPGEKLKDLVDAYVGCLILVKKYGYGLHTKKPDVDEKFEPIPYDLRVQRYQERRRAQLIRQRRSGASDNTLGRNW